MTETTQRTGLTTAEARQRQQQYGKNELTPQKKENFLKKILHVLREPMFLLLLLAAAIYFVLGEPRDGAIMLVFVVGIITIDVVQEWKTDQTLNALKDLSAPRVTVLRDGTEQEIASADLVPGDLMMICEGIKVPADGVVLRCADLCVDESSLTGEAEGVWKVPADTVQEQKDYWRRDYCYAGTLVTQGTALVEVDRIGAATEYGKIGLGVASAPREDTPLQRQTGKLVRTCAVIAGVLFVLVGAFTWRNLPDHRFADRLIESVLSGVTLAMAMIPEEFPVILTVFLSMGAWRLARKNSLVRRLPSVETLGAVSVLCVDKTGTITMNQMTVQELWTASGTERDLVETMGLGCETEAYDPMEKAMLRCCEEHGITRESLFENKFVTEYAFTNELKMMGHVWRKGDGLVIAAKGSPERILTICELTDAERAAAETQVNALSSGGLRVIAVAAARPESEAAIPAALTDCRLTLLGLVGLADPPRESVKDDIAVCNRAGIRVVMITGDNGVTASAIAKKIGIPGSGHMITGEALEAMTDEELRKAVQTVSIFSRVIPEHKMRIVKAFKENGEIVAMTGDGVNDAPALKYADIGIAMGKRGSEVSREAADLILMDDNFTTIVETVRDGRRIYDNIRKAVGYVFTIHIPIALSSLLAPFLGIAPTALFLLPLHVVLLEVLIDPTCSIVLERQPAERDIMARRPRNPQEKLLTAGLLGKSVLQGLTVFAASFGAYFITLAGKADNAPTARAVGLAVIMLANLFLVQVNSSDRDLAVRSIARLAKDGVMWAVNLGTLALLGLILYTPLSVYLKLAPLTGGQALTALALAAGSVLWYELVKIIRMCVRRS
ncbi:MAG: cation-translocating P-type ATPase [Pseudoflavonifractor sp.]|nr:cation-translocating P-type ATPase [Pseudoflavonifractor sp.]MDY3019638.1 cation-translocating P-type ATPase [Oscillospiraceae bacterium]